jgi:GNAT superfamily N-acetyltransferase
MKDLGVEITPFDPRDATDEEYAAANDFGNRMNAERMPDDPPTPLEEQVARWRTIPAYVNVHSWHVRPIGSGEIVASGSVFCARMGQNEHIAQFGISVAPERRRQGIATALLARIADAAQREGRTLLISGSSGRVPSGEAFLHRIGAEKGLESHTNQLDIAADLDRSLLTDWQERAKERASDYEMVFYEAPLPDDELPALLHVLNVTGNTIPRGSLQMEDSHLTAEQLRHMEESAKASGMTPWLCFARHKPTGAYVGFTVVFWHPNRPWLLNQGGTGVMTEHRNKGLGRWMKAVMLDQALARWPELRFVRTGNADTNAAMLSINHEMGFKPYVADIAWQVSTEKVFAYLAEKSG